MDGLTKVYDPSALDKPFRIAMRISIVKKGDNIRKLDEENNLVRVKHWIPSLYPPNINFIPRRVIVM